MTFATSDLGTVFLPAMADAERRSYLWVPKAWLEKKEHWPKADDPGVAAAAPLPEGAC